MDPYPPPRALASPLRVPSAAQLQVHPPQEDPPPVDSPDLRPLQLGSPQGESQVSQVSPLHSLVQLLAGCEVPLLECHLHQVCLPLVASQHRLQSSGALQAPSLPLFQDHKCHLGRGQPPVCPQLSRDSHRRVQLRHTQASLALLRRTLSSLALLRRTLASLALLWGTLARAPLLQRHGQDQQPLNNPPLPHSKGPAQGVTPNREWEVLPGLGPPVRVALSSGRPSLRPPGHLRLGHPQQGQVAQCQVAPWAGRHLPSAHQDLEVLPASGHRHHLGEVDLGKRRQRR